MPLAEIHVTLKPALFDAQGETIRKALHQLGHTGVQRARIGKFITLEIEGDDSEALHRDLDAMCQQLLANPVIEDFEISLPGVTPATETAPLETAPLETAMAAPAETPIEAAMAAPEPSAEIETAPETEVAPLQSAPIEVAPVEAVLSEEPIKIEPVTVGGIAILDPFTVDFRFYQGMPTESKMALRTLSLRKHGHWIESQLAEKGASWILCVGQNVLESGVGLSTYPTDQHLLKLGVQHDLVPWVFTRPTDN